MTDDPMMLAAEHARLCYAAMLMAKAQATLTQRPEFERLLRAQAALYSRLDALQHPPARRVQ